MYVPEYNIAHKYGEVDFMENDVAIVYTYEPFLLVVYTQFIGKEYVGLVAELMTRYTEHLGNLVIAEEEARIAAEEAARAEQEAAEAAHLAEIAEQERLAAEEAERQRLAAEEAAAAAEKARIEQERAAAEQAQLENELASLRTAAEDSSPFEWWMVPVALGTFGAGLGAVMLGLKKPWKKKSDEK